jgi:methylglutaconyl-CoA hydratase
MSSRYQTLQVSADSRGVLTIALNREDVRNAFNESVIAELTSVFEKETLDSKIRIVVLKGNGPVFCAGGDLNWMEKSATVDRATNLEDTRRLAKLFALMNECPKPLIGQVHGAAIGGGVGLVSVCDVVIAEAATQFSLSEVRLGIVPACIGPFVIAKIGASHARSLFVSAERFKAQRALEIGLVHQVTDEKSLAGEVEKLISNILQAGPQAVSVAKTLVLDLSWPERRAQMDEMGGPLEHVAQVLADVRVSAEGQEGVKAFLEKRKPSWLSR